MKVCTSSLIVNKGLNVSFQSQVKKCDSLAQWEQAVYSKGVVGSCLGLVDLFCAMTMVVYTPSKLPRCAF